MLRIGRSVTEPSNRTLTGQYLLRNKNLYKVIKICIDAFVPSLVESTETSVSPLVLVASVTEIEEELSGSVDPLTSATVVDGSENRAKHIMSTELVVTDIWKNIWYCIIIKIEQHTCL